jgi:hypothetical protein
VAEELASQREVDLVAMLRDQAGEFDRECADLRAQLDAAHCRAEGLEASLAAAGEEASDLAQALGEAASRHASSTWRLAARAGVERRRAGDSRAKLRRVVAEYYHHAAAAAANGQLHHVVDVIAQSLTTKEALTAAAEGGAGSAEALTGKQVEMIQGQRKLEEKFVGCSSSGASIHERVATLSAAAGMHTPMKMTLVKVGGRLACTTGLGLEPEGASDGGSGSGDGHSCGFRVEDDANIDGGPLHPMSSFVSGVVLEALSLPETPLAAMYTPSGQLSKMALQTTTKQRQQLQQQYRRDIHQGCTLTVDSPQLQRRSSPLRVASRPVEHHISATATATASKPKKEELRTCQYFGFASTPLSTTSVAAVVVPPPAPAPPAPPLAPAPADGQGAQSSGWFW